MRAGRDVVADLLGELIAVRPRTAARGVRDWSGSSRRSEANSLHPRGMRPFPAAATSSPMPRRRCSGRDVPTFEIPTGRHAPRVKISDARKPTTALTLWATRQPRAASELTLLEIVQRFIGDPDPAPQRPPRQPGVVLVRLNHGYRHPRSSPLTGGSRKLVAVLQNRLAIGRSDSPQRRSVQHSRNRGDSFRRRTDVDRPRRDRSRDTF